MGGEALEEARTEFGFRLWAYVHSGPHTVATMRTKALVLLIGAAGLSLVLGGILLYRVGHDVFNIAVSGALLKAEEKETHTSSSGNYRFEYSSAWKSCPVPEQAKEIFQFAVRKPPAQGVMISALETDSTVEELIDEFIAGQQVSGFEYKEIERVKRMVCGEPAIQIKASSRPTGVELRMYWTFFTHQGIAYRVYAFALPNRFDEARVENEAILESFRFLEERKEWLARYVGKPARTALLGGLATFVLKRPRWTETTLDERDHTGAHDSASYRFLRGNVNFMAVRARDARASAEAELDVFQAELTSRLSKTSRPTSVTLAKRAGEVPYVEVTGSFESNDYVLRGAVQVRGKLAVEVEMTTLKSLQDATLPDWTELLTSLHIEDPEHPQAPPAFSYRFEEPAQQPDPSLAVFLGKAKQVSEAEREYGHRVDLSRDGTKLLRSGRDGVFVETLATRRRERTLLPEAPHTRALGWSDDGRYVAVAGADAVHVLDLSQKKVENIDVRTLNLSFVPGTGDVLLSTTDESDPAGVTNGPALYSSQLVRVANPHGSPGAKRAAPTPTTLLQYPLSRVGPHCISPDGKRLAVVCNRDYPRTATTGGHLYVGNVDGTSLKQKSEGHEEILSVAWSPDGKWLYVVRRLAVGERGAVGIGGSSDLYRVSPDTGEALNLTRSGHIATAWAAGAELFLLVHDGELPHSQRGIFRIDATELERLTRDHPVPPIADAVKQSQAVAAALRKHIGPKSWLETVPTNEWLAQIAQAFADTMRSECGCALDFSTASLARLRTFRQIDRNALFALPEIQIGYAAYFGECLRRARGAQWQIKPVPFGQSETPAAAVDNPLVRVILPFEGVRRTFRDADADEDGPPWYDEHDLAMDQQILLVYPASHAAQAQRDAVDPDYVLAKEKLDRGEVEAGLELLARVLQKRPRNQRLATEIFALCRAAHLPQRVSAIVRQAVLAGNEVPDLLLSYADELTKKDAKAALPYYRKALQARWAPGSSLVKVGKVYEQLGQMDLAESCWRRAYWRCQPQERQQIRKWMGLPEASKDENP